MKDFAFKVNLVPMDTAMVFEWFAQESVLPPS